MCSTKSHWETDGDQLPGRPLHTLLPGPALCSLGILRAQPGPHPTAHCASLFTPTASEITSGADSPYVHLEC